MDGLIDRRRMLFAAGAVTAAAVSGSGAAQAANVQGTIQYEGGAEIPKGKIEIRVEGTAGRGDARHQAVRIESDGKSRSVEFSLSLPAGTAGPAEIVVRLVREDGWLLARGSGPFTAGAPVHIQLHTVMY